MTYDGKPVTRGVISIPPASGKGKGEGAKVLDGKYEIDQIASGQKRITVIGLTGGHGASPAAVLSSEDFSKQLGKSQRGGNEVVEIPANAEGNGQTVELTLGTQTVNVDLKPPPPPK